MDLALNRKTTAYAGNTQASYFELKKHHRIICFLCFIRPAKEQQQQYQQFRIP